MNFLVYVLDVTLLALLVWWLWRISAGSPFKKVFFLALSLKLIAGLALGLLYVYYYKGGDTLTFHLESLKLTSLFRSNVAQYFDFIFFNKGDALANMQYAGQPRAMFMVKILSLINLLTYDNYWLSSLFFSLFSFAGLWTFANRLAKIYPNREAAITLSLLFFPSIVFWSSGIIKETLALSALGFVLASFLGYFFRQKKAGWEIVIDLLMLFILWNTKYYYFGVLLFLIMAVVFTNTIIKYRSKIAWSAVSQLLVFGTFCLVSLISISFLHPNFYLDRIFGVIVDNYYAFVEKSDPGDVIIYHGLSPEWFSILSNTPKALVSGLFRPFIGESGQPLKVLAGIENLIICLLLITSCFKIPGKLSSQNRLLLVSSIMYCLILAVFLALSTPNFGTLIRYKTGFLPILLLVITIYNPLIEKLNPLIK